MICSCSKQWDAMAIDPTIEALRLQPYESEVKENRRLVSFFMRFKE
jgi:hypothetical protein